MKIFEIIERFELMYKLLKEKRTGSANEFASKVGLSRSQLFNYLDYLKSYELEIKYDEFVNSYIIENGKNLKIQQPIRVLKDSEKANIDAGSISFCDYLLQQLH